MPKTRAKQSTWSKIKDTKYLRAGVGLVVIGAAAVIGTKMLMPSHAEELSAAAATIPVAYISQDVNQTTPATTKLLDVAGGTTVRLQQAASTNESFDFQEYSPNHQFLLWADTAVNIKDFSRTTTFKLYNTATKKTKSIALPAGSHINQASPRWYADSSKFVYTAGTTQDPAGPAQLYTMTVAGVSTPVSGFDASNIDSMGVLGDSQHVVYARSGALYSFVPGQAPVAVQMPSGAGYCNTVTVLPTTLSDFAYTCSQFGSKVTATIVRQSIGAAPKVLFQSQGANTTGASYDTFSRVAPKADGSKLTYVSTGHKQNASCDVTAQEQIMMISSTQATTAPTSLFKGPKFAPNVCSGVGNPERDRIVWSPDGANIAFVSNQLATQNKFKMVVVSASGSGGTTQSAAGSTVTDLDW